MLTFDSFLGDLRHTIRSLWREKGFTAAVLLTFALCLGANIVIFTVVYSVVLAPLPFPSPDRVVIVYNSYPKLGIAHSASSVPNYFERRDLAAFSSVAAFRTGAEILGDSTLPERIPSMHVTPPFFDVVAVQPALGRLFRADENFYGKSDVVVLSDACWRARFHADPGVLGRKIVLNGNPTTIIGVLPPTFHYLSSKAAFWQPLPFSDQDRDPRARHYNTLDVIARLRPGVTIAQAQAQIDALNARLAKTDANNEWATGAGFRTTVAGLRDDHIASVRPALLLLQAGVLLLLLIGIVNVVNLLVVRATGRAKELTVRQVLGAGRRNLALQFVGETTLLALAGGLLGLGLGALALMTIERLGVDRLPLGLSVRLTPLVALVALGVSVLVGLLLAVPLVIFAVRGNLAPSLTVESRSGTTTRSTHRLRHALIAGQIALAFVLVASAGLLALSFEKVLAVSPGFRPDHVVTAWVGLPWNNYKDAQKRLDFANRWVDALRALPGVTAVGLGTSLPVVGEFGNLAMVIEGHPPPPGDAARAHHLGAATGEYFKAFGIPLHEGRLLNADDSKAEKPVCVIDDAFAHRYWPHESPLGRHVWIGGPQQPGDPGLAIVGVVGSVKQLGLSEGDAMGMLYYPLRKENASFGFAAIVRTQQDPASIVPALRKTLGQIDPGLPLDDIKTMTDRIDESLLLPRSLMLLAVIFGGMALLLAAVGVYGVLAFSVAQRQREIGVRLALGALPGDILRQFLRLGGALLLFGMVFGLVGAWFVARAMTSLLFGVSPGNPVVFAATAALLAVVVLLACVLPARRAAAVGVMDALRTD